jgi:hypothetical protein
LRISTNAVNIKSGVPFIWGLSTVNESHALIGLVAVLVLVAGVYTRKQIRTLYRTTPEYEMLPDERRFMRSQAWRRLANSGLMLVLAGLMASGSALGLEERADELGERRVKQRQADGVAGKMNDEDRQFSRLYGGYWITCLLLLGSILGLAGIDLMATRRYALKKLRQIQTDRRAMLQRQLERYRQERGGGTDSDT